MNLLCAGFLNCWKFSSKPNWSWPVLKLRGIEPRSAVFGSQLGIISWKVTTFYFTFVKFVNNNHKILHADSRTVWSFETSVLEWPCQVWKKYFNNLYSLNKITRIQNPTLKIEPVASHPFGLGSLQWADPLTCLESSFARKWSPLETQLVER